MLEFKKIELSDKQWIDELVRYSDFRGAEYNFTNLFIWEPVFGSKISRYKDFLLLRSGDKESVRYLFPGGRGDYREVIEILRSDAASFNSPLILMATPPQMRDVLESLYPGVKFEPVRNSFDYIYEKEALSSLAGKKLQPKRNHLNRFAELPGITVEQITPQNIEEIREFTAKWCIEAGGCDHNKSLESELCAVGRALKYFGELSLEGIMIKLEGKVVAYTIGEKLNSDTYIVHIEKATTTVRGAYQFVNREFSLRMPGEIIYVNREDDAGDEGLRRAKESYNPVFMQEKYNTIFF
jgi:hypothetical protein